MPNFKPSWLDRLFQRHRHELKAFASQKYGQEAADDLVQDAYLRLMQHPEPESIENARAFLYRTVANLSIDRHRRQATRDRFVSDEGDLENDILSVVDSTKTPEQEFMIRQELQHLDAFLLELPADTRHAFVLYRLEGLSHREVGLRLGISERSSVRLVADAAHHLMLRFGSFNV